MLVLPVKPERGTVKYSDHATFKPNASPSGNQMGARLEKRSSDALKHVTPASHSGLSTKQNGGHPENRSGIDPVVYESGQPVAAAEAAFGMQDDLNDVQRSGQ